jgi:hypothetical protein
MKTVKQKPGKYRVGEWVSFLFGPRLVLGQILADRDPLDVSSRRFYTVRLDLTATEPWISRMAEEELQKTTEADRVAWQKTGKIGIQQILGYWHKDGDQRDHTKPLYHYLVVAKPGPQAGSGTATIILLSGQRAVGVSEESLPTLRVSSGGPEAALAKAKEYLDAQHAGLKTWASDPMR